MSPSAFEDDGDAVIEMDVLPPRWADVSDEITELLAQIATQSSKLDKLHQKHVLPGFDDDDVKRDEERQIEKLTQGITRGFHECQNAIKRIDSMVKEAQAQGSISRAEETMARNIQTSLASRVQEASALFRKKQSAYLKKLRGLTGLVSPAPRVGTPSYTDTYATDPSLMDSETDKSYSQSTLMTQTHLSSNDAAIMQREREITDIANGIIELADIFKELQAMIIDQGTMLDRIDYNVEQMATHVKGADKELKVASGYQQKSVKRKIMLLLILLIVGLFILLLLKPKGGTVREIVKVVDEKGNEVGAENTHSAVVHGGAPGLAARVKWSPIKL